MGVLPVCHMAVCPAIKMYGVGGKNVHAPPKLCWNYDSQTYLAGVLDRIKGCFSKEGLGQLRSSKKSS